MPTAIDIKQELVAAFVHDNDFYTQEAWSEFLKLSEIEKKIIHSEIEKTMLIGMFLLDMQILKDIKTDSDDLLTPAEKNIEIEKLWKNSPNEEQYKKFYREYEKNKTGFVKSYLRRGIEEFDPRFSEAVKFYLGGI